MSSSIYDTRLENKIRPNRERLLKESKTTIVPDFLMVGNTKPNFDFQTNRLLQPVSSSKKPLLQNPFLPKNNLIASGLGGRKPFHIDYVTSERKPIMPRELIWETNIVRELRNNVYPDGTPKNNVPAQSADSAYIERLHADKKLVDLEKTFEQRGGKGARPHPDAIREAELKKLENLIAETKYGPTYKNVALSAENHAKLASKNAEQIRAELDALKREALVHKVDIVDALENLGAGSEDPGDTSISKTTIAPDTTLILPTNAKEKLKADLTKIESAIKDKKFDKDSEKSLKDIAKYVGIDEKEIDSSTSEDILKSAQTKLDNNVYVFSKGEYIPLEAIFIAKDKNPNKTEMISQSEKISKINMEYYEESYKLDNKNKANKDNFIKNLILNKNPKFSENEVDKFFEKFKSAGNARLYNPDKIKAAYDEFEKTGKSLKPSRRGL